MRGLSAAAISQAVIAFTLTVLSAAPGPCEPVVVGKGKLPSWSPDGRSLAWWAGAGVMVLRPGSTAPETVAKLYKGMNQPPVWLPSGQSLLVTGHPEVATGEDDASASRRPNVLLIELATGGVRRLTDFADPFIRALTVDPTGRYVVLQGPKEGTPFTRVGARGSTRSTDPREVRTTRGLEWVPFTESYSGLWLLDLHTGGGTLLLPTDRAMEDMPQLSPDGVKVLYTRLTRIQDVNMDDPWETPAPRADVAVFDLRSRVSYPMSDTGQTYGGAWSPDGRWIAYRRILRGSNLWVMAADGTRRRLIESGRNARPATASPSLKWIGNRLVTFFDSATKDLVAVGIDGRGPYTLASPLPDVETMYGFSLHPDNRRIAYTTTPGEVCVTELDWSQVPADLRP